MKSGLREFQRNGSDWIVGRVLATTRRPITLGLCDEVGLGKTHVAADAAWRLLDRGFRMVIYVSPNLTLAQQNRPKIAKQAAARPKAGAPGRRPENVLGGGRLTLLLPASLLGRRGGRVVDVSQAVNNESPLRSTSAILVSAHTSLQLTGRGLRRERIWLRALLQWHLRSFARSSRDRREVGRLVRTLRAADEGLLETRATSRTAGAYGRMLRRQRRRDRKAIGGFVRKWLARLRRLGGDSTVRDIREEYRQAVLERVGPVVWLIDEYQQYADLFGRLKDERKGSRDAFILMSATPFEVPEDADGAARHEDLRGFVALLDDRLERRLFDGEKSAFEAHWNEIRELVRAYRTGALKGDAIEARVEAIRRDHVAPLERLLTRSLTRHERPPVSIPPRQYEEAADWRTWLVSYGHLERLGAKLSRHAWTTELWNHAPSFPLTSGAVYKLSEAVTKARRSALGREAALLQAVLPLENVNATFKSARFVAALRKRLERAGPSGSNVRPIWLAPAAAGVPGKLVVFTRYFASGREGVLAAEAVNGHGSRRVRKPKRPPFRLGLRDSAWPFFWPGWRAIVERVAGNPSRRRRQLRSLTTVLDSDLRFFRKLQRDSDAGDTPSAYIARALRLDDWKCWSRIARELKPSYREGGEGFGGTALAAFARYAKAALDVSVQFESEAVPNVVQHRQAAGPSGCLGTALADALLRVCEAEGVTAWDALPLLVARWARLLDVLLAFAHYFRRESVQRARGLGSTKRWTERAYRRSLEAAVRDDELSGAIQELAFTMQPERQAGGDDPTARAEARIDALLDRLDSVLAMDDQRLGLLVRGRGEKRSLRPLLVPCGLGMTLTDDEADESAPERRSTERKIEAFNSPFFPFCIVLGSAAEHGLDFHHFCDGVVHWDAPRSAVHWEQRVGRVIRFRHLALRRHLLGQVPAGAKPANLLEALEWAFQAEAGSDGRVPDWQAPSDVGEPPPTASWPDELMLSMPGTAEHRRFQQTDRERTFLRLSLGHPDRVRFLEVMEREARTLTPEQVGFLHKALSRLALDLQPRRRRTTRAGRGRGAERAVD